MCLSLDLHTFILPLQSEKRRDSIPALRSAPYGELSKVLINNRIIDLIEPAIDEHFANHPATEPVQPITCINEDPYLNVGVRVTVQEIVSGEALPPETHTLTDQPGDNEQNLLNIKAPLAVALLGKTIGDEVTYSVNTFELSFMLIDIQRG